MGSPELAAALVQARKARCPVVVAKLDRLSRDVIYSFACRLDSLNFGRGQNIIRCRHRDCYLGHRFLRPCRNPSGLRLRLLAHGYLVNRKSSLRVAHTVGDGVNDAGNLRFRIRYA
jgi:hypothetical protein